MEVATNPVGHGARPLAGWTEPTFEQKMTILRAGREKVRRGWIQNVTAAAYKPIEGRAANGMHSHLANAGYVCALGGLVYGTEEVYRNPSLVVDDLHFDILWLLYAALPKSYRRHEDDDLRVYEMINKVSGWNDKKSRSRADVLRLYDQAIEKLSKEVRIGQQSPSGD